MKNETIGSISLSLSTLESYKIELEDFIINLYLILNKNIVKIYK
jgi:hypothetical protein